MSRHRNVRNLDLDDELYDDIYGQSLDEQDYGVSPGTEAEFMFRRDRDHTIGSFIGDRESKIDEVDEQRLDDEKNLNLSSSNYQRPTLDPVNQAKLQSCIEQLEDVLGSCHEKTAVEAVLNNNFDVERALNQLLNKPSTATLSSSTSRIACASPSWSFPAPAPAVHHIPSVSKSGKTLNLKQ